MQRRSSPRLPTLLLPALLFAPSLAVAQDSDVDGVSDALDLYPCDAAASAVAFAPAEGQFALLMAEDQWPLSGDLDFNDAVVGYNYVFRLNGSSQVTQVIATLSPRAAGGIYPLGVGLRLPVLRSSVGQVTRRIGTGAATTLTPSATDSELTLRVIDSLFPLFGAAGGPVNSVDGAAPTEAQTVEVTINFSTPVSLNVGSAPFDLFLFRVQVPGHEIHLPAYAGTSAFDAALVGTGNDATTATRRFVDTGGMPFLLVVPLNTPHPRERQPISGLFPNIIAFAASGGNSAQDFYTSQVVSSAAYVGQAGFTRPSPALLGPSRPASDFSCLVRGPGGNLTVSSTFNLNTSVRAGDTAPPASIFSVSAIAPQQITATTPVTGIGPGDEVMVINLRGSSPSVGAVGTYESFLTVRSVSGSVINLWSTITQVFGATSNADLSGQVVVVMRVPRFDSVTVSSGGILTASPYGTAGRGGLVIFRATTVNVQSGGRIDASALGYRGAGPASNGRHGSAGESYSAPLGTVIGGPANGGAGGGGQSDCNVQNCTTQTFGAAGGGGGFGTAGTAGANNGSLHVGGVGGPSYGSANLARLFFGSGGGGGAGGVSGPGSATEGGNGGGVIGIDATTLTINGGVWSQGQAGSTNDNCSFGRGSGGGGGGAGGTIWLSAQSMTVGAGAISAAGAGATCLGGGTGGGGRVRLDYGTLNGVAYGSASSAGLSTPAVGFTTAR
jgi:LruC domain-containing protein